MESRHGPGGQARELVARYRPVAYSVSDVVPPQVPDLASTYVLAGGDLASRGERVEAAFCRLWQAATNQPRFRSSVEAPDGGSPWPNASPPQPIP